MLLSNCEFGYSQTLVLSTLLSKNENRKDLSTNFDKFLHRKSWNDLFPHRYGIGLKDTVTNNPDFYSLKSFVTAARVFPGFLSEGDEQMRKRELCAFLANVAQETSGGWDDAPGGYF